MPGPRLTPASAEAIPEKANAVDQTGVVLTEYQGLNSSIHRGRLDLADENKSLLANTADLPYEVVHVIHGKHAGSRKIINLVTIEQGPLKEACLREAQYILCINIEAGHSCRFKSFNSPQ